MLRPADAFLNCGRRGQDLLRVLEAVRLALVVVMLVTLPVIREHNLAQLLRGILCLLVPST